MPRYRIVIGFKDEEPSKELAIVTIDDTPDVVMHKVKTLDENFKTLSTRPASMTEALVIMHNNQFYERIIEFNELKKQLEHYRRQPAKEVIPQKKPTNEDAKPF